MLRESLVQPSPLSKNCIYPKREKGLAKSLWTPHIQHTPSLNCYRLVHTTDLWAPEWPDTGTISSLKQSISRTLEIKRRKHNIIIHYLIITNTCIFYFKFAHSRPVHTSFSILYIVFLLFCTLPICIFVYYYFIICVLSCCCHSVALWSFCHYYKFLVCVNIPGQ